jgi:hypothetical protein
MPGRKLLRERERLPGSGRCASRAGQGSSQSITRAFSQVEEGWRTPLIYTMGTTPRGAKVTSGKPICTKCSQVGSSAP